MLSSSTKRRLEVVPPDTFSARMKARQTHGAKSSSEGVADSSLGGLARLLNIINKEREDRGRKAFKDGRPQSPETPAVQSEKAFKLPKEDAEVPPVPAPTLEVQASHKRLTRAPKVPDQNSEAWEHGRARAKREQQQASMQGVETLTKPIKSDHQGSWRAYGP